MKTQSRFVIWCISWNPSASGWFGNVEVTMYTSILGSLVRSSSSRLVLTRSNTKRVKYWIC